MPPTMEIVCDEPDCDLDMFEVHYTYEMSHTDVGVGDFRCPYCGSVESLHELTYTYRDSR